MRATDELLAQHILDEEKRLLGIEGQLKALETKLTSLDLGVADLVSAWKTAGNLVTFVKWLAGLAAAIIALVAFIKTGFLKP